MKLLTELVNFDAINVLEEENEKKEKVFRLEGTFLEADIKNKNGRVYPMKVLTREVNDFSENRINTNRAMGELDHPENPQINLDRVSHVIESLKMEGNRGMGVARLIDTPMGRIAKTLVSEGVLMGMSTRGVGSLDGDHVKDDYKMITIDIVADPSAPNSFVEGVLENKEYIVGDDGEFVEVAIKKMKESVDKKYGGNNMSQHALRHMMKFISDIQDKK